jgi:hypothetical protein
MPRIKATTNKFNGDDRQLILTDGYNCDNFLINGTEKEFLEFCREFGWGEVVVTIKDGRPVMAKIVHQDFKFD